MSEKRKRSAAEYREGIRKAISATGKWLQENSEAILPEIDFNTGLTISIVFDPEIYAWVPKVVIETGYIPHEATQIVIDMQKEKYDE